MEPASLKAAIGIIGEEGISDDSIGEHVLVLAEDAMLAKWVIDWRPEVLGAVAVGQLGKVDFMDAFSANTKNGQWKNIPMKAEPIFGEGIKLAQGAWNRDWAKALERVAFGSAIMNSVGNLVETSQSLEGAATSGPALIGNPAKINRSGGSLLQRAFW